MKRAYSTAEKSLFAAPLLFIALGIGAWAWRQKSPIRLQVPANADVEIVVQNLTFSPDGSRLAVALSRDLVPKNEPVFPAQIIDVRTHSKICDLAPLPSGRLPNLDTYDDTPSSYSLSWSPDGTRIVLASPYISIGNLKADGKTRSRPNYICRFAVWNAESGELIGEYPYAPPDEDSLPDRLRFSADGQRIIGSGEPPSIFDAKTGERRQVFRVGHGTLIAGTINDELQLCAQVRSNDLRVQVFDLKTKKLIWQTKRDAFDSDFGNQLCWNGSILSGRIQTNEYWNGNETFLLWDGKTRQRLLSPPCVDCSDLEFFRDDSTLAYLGYFKAPNAPSSFERKLVVWDYRRHKVLWRQPVSDYAHDVKASPDGKWLSVVEPIENNLYTPATLKVYDRQGKLCLQQTIGNFPTAWTPDSSRIAIVQQNAFEPPQIEFVRVGE